MGTAYVIHKGQGGKVTHVGLQFSHKEDVDKVERKEERESSSVNCHPFYSYYSRE
jgi:hypothetical protein